MKHLLQVAQMIQAANLATEGTDLFIGTIPADVKRGVMLRDPLIGVEIDEGMENFYSFDFQVIVRDPDVQAGVSRANAIQALLKLQDLDCPEIFISWMRPKTKPISYPRGDANDIETSFWTSIGYGEK